MKKRALCILAVIIVYLLVPAPAGAETFEFRDPDKITGNNMTKIDNPDILLSPETPQPGTPSVLDDYIFSVEGNAPSISLGALERSLTGGGSGSMTFVMPKASIADKFAVVKSGEDTMGRYWIPNLLNAPDAFEAEEKSYIVSADEKGDNIHLKIYLTELSITAEAAQNINFVYVTAEYPLWRENRAVYISLVGKNDPTKIGYITEARARNGKVSAEFKFTGDTDEFIAVVTDGMMQSSCSVVKTVSETAAEASLSLSLSEDGESVSVRLSANDAFIGTTDASIILLAFYDEDGALTECTSERFRQRTLSAPISEGTACVKAFALSSLEALVPHTAAATLKLGKK